MNEKLKYSEELNSLPLEDLWNLFGSALDEDDSLGAEQYLRELELRNLPLPGRQIQKLRELNDQRVIKILDGRLEEGNVLLAERIALQLQRNGVEIDDRRVAKMRELLKEVLMNQLELGVELGNVAVAQDALINLDAKGIEVMDDVREMVVNIDVGREFSLSTKQRAKLMKRRWQPRS